MACGGTIPAPAEPAPRKREAAQASRPSAPPPARRPFRRAAGLGVLLALFLVGLLAWQGAPLLAGLAREDLLPSLLCLGAAAMGLWLVGVGRGPLRRPPGGSSPRRRVQPAALALLVLVPLTLLAGTVLFQGRRYFFLSLLLLFEVLVPMTLSFEAGGPGPRRLVVLAVLTALAAAGRAAFFMLPQFKPMAAVAILAGAAFGGQAGFLVGAASMLVSNFFFVQGVWTPWQIAAM